MVPGFRINEFIVCVVDKWNMYKWQKPSNYINHVVNVAGTDVFFNEKKLVSNTWWRHLETFSASLAIFAGNSPVNGEFPAQRPVTRSFDVFFDLRINNRLSKQS